MANSGTLHSGNMPGTSLEICFDWSISNINNSAGTATLTYKLYGVSNSNIEYRVFGTGDRNYCNLDGASIFYLSSTGSGSQSNPYPMYCRESSHSLTPTYAQPPNYTFSGYIIKYGILASGSKTIYYNDDGYTSFSVYGAFQCYYGAGSDKRVYISSTITPDKIERYSKAQRSSNSGSNWYQDKFAYYTNDYGQTWTKCNLHKTTNSGSTWNKIT